ncbi:type II toxin-antitoxin system RelB family antitoxin [Phascolarctobacterium sp.]
MSISIRLNAQEDELIKNFAKLNGLSVSEYIRSTIMKHIEDEIDLQDYKKALQEFKKNPKTYTHEEMVKMLEADE